MNIKDIGFHRIFSKTMYKNLKLPLWEMTFTKDFVSDKRGDLYPVINKSDDCEESVEHNRYNVKSGSVSRLVGSFFSYATQEITFNAKCGLCGFEFVLPEGKASVTYKKGCVAFSDGKAEESVLYENASEQVTMIVSCRPEAFDVYFLCNGQPEYFHTFRSADFENSNDQKVFSKGYVSLLAADGVTVCAVSSYIDCGISQADMRPIRYENGDVIFENGKVFLSLSVRIQEKMFQGIVSWVPSTSDFELTGALFYDSGDGKWCGDVAASILFNRKTNEWNLWVCSFSHGHVLGHAAFEGDPRFGVNVVDIKLMDKVGKEYDATEFLGFEGDEDPDFYYNEQEDKWYMAICRIDPSINSYRYMFFTSDNPFDNYKFIGQGCDGAETGGSFVTIDGEKVFACGNSFEKRSDYRIYTKDGMYNPKFDFDDGGVRGWGTIIPVKMGSRTRYFWMTFDRHNASSYNWSYGNVYCFEAEL